MENYVIMCELIMSSASCMNQITALIFQHYYKSLNHNFLKIARATKTVWVPVVTPFL
jgi:hypothetical protein